MHGKMAHSTPQAPTKVHVTEKERHHLILLQRLHLSQPRLNPKQLIDILKRETAVAPSNLVIRAAQSLIIPR
jgi:hypothetical protein